MPYTLQLYTVEVVDPPPGWDDKLIDVRHRNIPADQIGSACRSLLELSYRQWLSAGRPGNATPSVVVKRLNFSSPSS